MQQLGKSVASLVYAAVVHWQWTLLVAVHSSAAAAAAAPLHQPSWGAHTPRVNSVSSHNSLIWLRSEGQLLCSAPKVRLRCPDSV